MKKHSHARRTSARERALLTRILFLVAPTAGLLLMTASFYAALTVSFPLRDTVSAHADSFSAYAPMIVADPAPQPLPYVEDFSLLVHSSNLYPAGWQGWILGGGSTSAFRTVAPVDSVVLAPNSTSSTTSGAVHNYNGKIGLLATGGVDPAVVLALDTTGFNSVNVAFDMMTIRNQKDATNTRINQVDLQYRICPAEPLQCAGAFASVSGNPNGIYENNAINQTSPATTTPQKLENKSLVLPDAANDQPNVQIRWVQRDSAGGGSRPSFAIDNLNVTGAATCEPPSVISHPASVAITYGDDAVFSAAVDEELSVVWEVSTDAGTTWASTGVVTTTLTVPRPSVAQSGNSYRAVFTSACDNSMSVTTSAAALVVNPKVVSAEIFVGPKTYDGTTAATITACSFIDVLAGDDLTCVPGGATATFASANAGLNKPVTAVGLAKSGSDAPNYLFDGIGTGLGNIDKASTVTLVTFEPPPYVYRASAFTASAQATGAGGLNQSVPVVYIGDCTKVTWPNGCTASASFPEGANHLASEDSANITIAPAPVTATAGSGNAVYDGQQKSPDICAITGALTGDLTCTNDPPSVGPDAGVYETLPIVSGADLPNFAVVSVGGSFEISPASSSTFVECPASVVYGGIARTPCTVLVSGAGGLELAPTPDYANNLNVGTATASYSFAGDPNHTGSSDAKTFEITRRPATWTTQNNGKFFGQSDPNPLTTGSGFGFFAADGVTATYTRDPGADVGIYHISSTLSSAIAGALNNYAIRNTGARFTINPDPTSITPDENIDGVNNDCVNDTYAATLKDAVTNTGLPNVSLKMTIGTQTAIATTDIDGVATFTLVLSQPPGDVTQTFEIDGTWTDPNRTLAAPVTRPFSISGDPTVGPAADADSIYTGSLFFWTTSATSSTATLTLSATVKDKFGACSNGDITTAKVSFHISSNGGGSFSPVSNAQNLPVGLVNPNEPNVGSASAVSPYNIGSSQSVTLIVRVVVGGYYNYSNADYDIPITIGKLGTANSLMGGGKLKNDNNPFAASGYFGLNSISSTFGSQVQYNKKGSNPHGQVTVYVRSCNFPNGGVDVLCVPSDPATHHVYLIKSNSISELALISGSASFGSKTNVSEVMQDGTKITLDGGNTMQLMFTPHGIQLPPNNTGNPIGTTCTFQGGCASIVIYRSSAIGGGVWYSSSWGQPLGRPLQTWLMRVVNGTVAVQ